MGGALLRGWLERDVLEAGRSAVFDPAPASWVKEASRNGAFALNPELQSGAYDALVLAVKPQAAADAAPRFSAIAANALTISIMAGKSVRAISAALGGAHEIVRAMPNLPSAVGAGVTSLYSAFAIDERRKLMADRLMGAVGETLWVDSEEAIDAVTAVSGSGPAYFFLLGEALAEAGEKAGLTREAAALLARATLIGAGAYAGKDPRTLGEMRRSVTSPGGTTEAALNIFDGESQALRKLVSDAVSAAKKRAGELTD